MGQELQRLTPGTVSRADPSWPTVAGTTVRLWLPVSSATTTQLRGVAA